MEEINVRSSGTEPFGFVIVNSKSTVMNNNCVFIVPNTKTERFSVSGLRT
ncbi:hypothetical protein MA16_Dca013269 [Dendrobium catenatum]|uniref:Uncharacterized protein n=1 Tax=Dendrobium catenatum TaxID=906689 RepID=A0A2I0WDE6_9ASPA|nr:hypothetical protein MA16_Dca013269 [Dendrobium catenatum]